MAGVGPLLSELPRGGKMKYYNDDDEIMALAERDGCAQELRNAMKKGKGKSTAVLTPDRVYAVCTAPGDTGYICIEHSGPLEMLRVMATLPKLMGCKTLSVVDFRHREA